MAKVTDEELQELLFKQKNGIKLNKEEKQILKENSADEKEKKSKMSFGERMKKASGNELAQLMNDDVDRYAIKDYISTGNILFNAQLSGDGLYGGVPSSRITQLVGINSTGKSYLSIQTAIEAQKKGYYVVIFDSEAAITKKEMKDRGLDLDQVLYIPVQTVEDLRTTLLNMLEDVGENDKLFIIQDSLGNLSTNKELSDSLDGKETADMTRSRLLKSLFRTITVPIATKSPYICMVCVNHVYAQIGGFMSGGSVVGGGSGSLYNSSIIVEFTKAQDKNQTTGKVEGAIISATTIKSRTSREKQKTKFNLSFDNGLEKYSGLELFCEDEKIFVKDKQSFKLNKDKVGNLEFYKDQSFSKSKLTPQFWQEFLEVYLNEYLKARFKYQSATDDLIDDLDDDEDD